MLIDQPLRIAIVVDGLCREPFPVVGGVMKLPEAQATARLRSDQTGVGHQKGGERGGFLGATYARIGHGLGNSRLTTY